MVLDKDKRGGLGGYSNETGVFYQEVHVDIIHLDSNVTPILFSLSLTDHTRCGRGYGSG